MNRGVKVTLCFILLAAVCAAVFPGGSQTGIAAIRKQGFLRVGVKADVPKFGLLDTSRGVYEGMEIEIAKLVAKEILGDPEAVAFTPVTVYFRENLLTNNEIDIIIATYTINDERKARFNISPPYYTDTIGLMVRKDSGIHSLKDCNGKTLGIVQGSTSKNEIQNEADKLGIRIYFSEFATYPEIVTALQNGKIDAFTTDRSILSGYVNDATVILPDNYAPQPYGIVCRQDDKALARIIDRLVTRLQAEGALTALAKKFGL